jgi:hypothetical protein
MGRSGSARSTAPCGGGLLPAGRRARLLRIASHRIASHRIASHRAADRSVGRRPSAASGRRCASRAGPARHVGLSVPATAAAGAPADALTVELPAIAEAAEVEIPHSPTNIQVRAHAHTHAQHAATGVRAAACCASAGTRRRIARHARRTRAIVPVGRGREGLGARRRARCPRAPEVRRRCFG